MAVTWNISTLEYNNDADKGVIHAAWTCSDSETVGEVVHSGTVSGMESFTPDSTADGWTAYADLTEAQVLGWVHSTIGDDEKARVETKVATQITVSQTPVSLYGMPWAEVE